MFNLVAFLMYQFYEGVLLNNENGKINKHSHINSGHVTKEFYS